MMSGEEIRFLVNRYYAFKSGDEQSVLQCLADLCEAHLLDPIEPGDASLGNVFEAEGELLLSATWQGTDKGYLLVIDVSYDAGQSPLISEFEKSLDALFHQSILIFSELGRERNLILFQQISDLENALRELIVQKMLEHEGTTWWDHVLPGLQDRGRARKQKEIDSPLYDCYPQHDLFYIEFDDLHRLIDGAHDVFDPVFRHRNRINLADEIAKLNELRNRVMHGRYLTEKNEQAIQIACDMFDRILQRHIQALGARRLGRS
jgi:hypothetical protein